MLFALLHIYAFIDQVSIKEQHQYPIIYKLTIVLKRFIVAKFMKGKAMS
jgi:hypothetical protein